MKTLTLSQNGARAQWKLSSFDGKSFQWLEWFGQFKTAINSKATSNAVKMTYLETQVSDKAKNVNTEIADSGTLTKTP